MTRSNDGQKEWELIINSLFPELNLIVEGRKVSDSAMFYNVNVLILATMTHEEFCAEFPETSKILNEYTRKQEKLQILLSEEK